MERSLKLSPFKKNIIIDLSFIILALLLSILVYTGNSAAYEREAVTDLIKQINNKSESFNIKGEIISVLWITNDFENWIPYIYNKNKYKNPEILKTMHPNIHPDNIRTITLNFSNYIFTAWIKKNSHTVIFRYFLIPFLIITIILFTLKMIFFYVLKVLNISAESLIGYENNENETDIHDNKSYNLTEDELEGLLRE